MRGFVHMKLLLLLLLLLLQLLDSGLSVLSGKGTCRWAVTTIKTSSAFSKPERIPLMPSYHSSVFSVTKQMSDKVHIYGMNFSKGETEFLAYKYSLRIDIECDTEEEKQTMGRSAIILSFTVLVELCRPVNEQDARRLCVDYEATRIEKLGREPAPYWILPIIRELSTGGVELGEVQTEEFPMIPYFQFTLSHDYYQMKDLDRLTTVLIPLKDFKGFIRVKLAITSTTGIHLIPRTRMADVNYEISSRESYARSQSQFLYIINDIPTMQDWARAPPPKGGCSCLSEAENPFYPTAHLPGSLLLATERGVLYVLLEWDSSFENRNKHWLSDDCIGEMIVRLAARRVMVTLVGACRDEGKLFYFSPATEKTGMVYRKTLDTSAARNHPCHGRENSCRMVASMNFIYKITVEQTELCEYGIVLSFGPRHKPDFFALVVYNEARNDWDDTHRFDGTLIPKTLHEDINMLELNGTYQAEVKRRLQDPIPEPQQIQIKGIAIANHVSFDIYIYGSHLLYSLDFVKASWIETPFKSGIVHMTASYLDYMAILTEDDQIWIMLIGGLNFKLIVPSFETNKVLGLLNISTVGIDAKPFSLYFEMDENLIYVTNDGGLLRSFTLPINRILQYRTVLDELEDQLGGTKSNESCPFETLTLSVGGNQDQLRYETYEFSSRSVIDNFKYGEPKQPYYIYNTAVYEFMKQRELRRTTCSDCFSSAQAQLHSEMLDKYEPYARFLAVNGLLRPNEYAVRPSFYRKIYNKPSSSIHDGLPKYVYLDAGEVMTLAINLRMQKFHDIQTSERYADRTAKGSLYVLVGRNACIKAEVVRSTRLRLFSIIYTITVENTCVDFKEPTSAYTPELLSIFIVDAILNCFMEYAGQLIHSGMIAVTVLCGCSPGKSVAFSPRLSREEEMRSKLKSGSSVINCLNPSDTIPCFDFNSPFYPTFVVKNEASNEVRSYNDRFTLTVIAVSYEPSANPQLLTEEEILLNNAVGNSVSSLIWRPHERDILGAKAVYAPNGLPIYRMENDSSTISIKWMCGWRSACRRILPGFFSPNEVYLLLKFSNWVPNPSSSCDYNTTFWIRIQGVPTDQFMIVMPVAFGTWLVCCLVMVILYSRARRRVVRKRMKVVKSRSARRQQQHQTSDQNPNLVWSVASSGTGMTNTTGVTGDDWDNDTSDENSSQDISSQQLHSQDVSSHDISTPNI